MNRLTFDQSIDIGMEHHIVMVHITVQYAIVNTPHSRTVYNFTGIIKFQRPKIFKFFAIEPKFFIPYRFTIIGYCEDIELNSDNT